jgi:hypothetical protein
MGVVRQLTAALCRLVFSPIHVARITIEPRRKLWSRKELQPRGASPCSIRWSKNLAATAWLGFCECARGVLGEAAVTDVMRAVFDYLAAWMALASSLVDGLGMQTRFDTLPLRDRLVLLGVTMHLPLPPPEARVRARLHVPRRLSGERH